MPDAEDLDRGFDLEYLDGFSQATLVTDKHCRLVYLNTAAERMVGVRRDLLLGRPLAAAVFSSDHQGAAREVCEQVLRGLPWAGALDALRADGSTAYTEVSCAPLRRASEVVGLVFAMAEDRESPEQDHHAHRLADRLTGLARVNAELAVAEDLETVTKVVISEAADAVGATVGSLSLLVDDDTLMLVGLR